VSRRLAPTLLLAAAATLGAPARAASPAPPERSRTLWSLTWEGGSPAGDVTGFLHDTSWAGLRLDVRFFPLRSLSAGIVTDWARYDQTFSLLTETTPDSAVSGPVYRYVDTFSVRAAVHWYPLDGAFRPYLGATAGAAWTYVYQQSADLATADTQFGFVGGPDLGVLVAIARGVAVDVGASWSYTTADLGSTHDAQWVGWRLGFAWSY
jgi:hypothetical protein